MKFNIKKFIKRMRTNQTQLANQLGVSQSLIAAWSTGRGYPTYEMIYKLLSIGMTIDELYGEEEAKALRLESRIQQDNVMPSREICERIVQLGMQGVFGDNKIV